MLLAEIRADEWAWKQRSIIGEDMFFRRVFAHATLASDRLSHVLPDEVVGTHCRMDLCFLDPSPMTFDLLSSDIPTEVASNSNSEAVGTHVNAARVLRRLRALMQVHNVSETSSPEAALQAGLQHYGGLLTILAVQLGQEPKALWFLKEGALDSVVWVHCHTSM